MSTFVNAGTDGNPDIVRISPHSGYRNPASTDTRMSRMGSR